MSDEPDTTTYIARTEKGWAAGPNKMAAEIRAIVNSYPDPDVDHYKVEIFKVDATDWEVTGLGGISSTYVEEIHAYIMPGEKATRLAEHYNDAERILGQGEPIKEEEE